MVIKSRKIHSQRLKRRKPQFTTKRKFFLVSMALFFFFEGQIMEIGTGSFSRRAGFTILALSTLLLIALAPRRPARHMWIAFVGCLLIMWPLIAFVIPANVAWIVGAGLAVTQVGVTLALAMRFAVKNFLQLQELQATAPVATRLPLAQCSFVHITDLHVTIDERTARYQGGRGGYEGLQRCLCLIKKLRPRYVFVTGDITDTGSQIEWSRFMGAIRAEVSSSTRVIMAPGNHDLSPHYAEDGHHKMRSFLEYQAALAPDLVASNDQTIGTVVAEAMIAIEPRIDERKSELQRAASFWPNHFLCLLGGEEDLYRRMFLYSALRPELQGLHDIAKETLLDDWFEDRWHDLFPLHLAAPEEGIFLIVLNSISPSMQTIGDSALGAFGAGQLNRLTQLLDSIAPWTRTVIILLHHPCFRRPGEWRLPFPNPFVKGTGWFSNLQQMFDLAFLAHDAEEGRNFVDLVSAVADKKRGVDFFILCGHRHHQAAGQAGRATFLEGSSLSESDASAWLIYLASDRPVLHSASL